MKTNLYILVIIFFLSFVIVSNLFTQEIPEKPDLITDEKKKLLILPAVGTDLSSNSIDAEITSTVAGIAVKLQRFEVIDRNNLSEILEEQALHQTGLIDDSTAISLGKIAASEEALIVTVTNFTQAGVPPSDDNDEDDDDQNFAESIISSIVEGIFSGGSDEDESDPYPDNIQTQLSVQVRKIDVETGESLDSYDIAVSHTGGTRGVSRAKAIQKFKAATINELKGLYLLSSEVISVEGNGVPLNRATVPWSTQNRYMVFRYFFCHDSRENIFILVVNIM